MDTVVTKVAVVWRVRRTAIVILFKITRNTEDIETEAPN